MKKSGIVTEFGVNNFNPTQLHSPLIPFFLCLMMLVCACSQRDKTEKPESDSLLVPTDSLPLYTETLYYNFTYPSLFARPFDFNFTDTLLLKKKCEVFSVSTESMIQADSTPWYTTYFIEGTLAITFYDFYKNMPKRYYLKSVFTQSPSILFANNVRVGMSREDFLAKFSLQEDAAKKADVIQITDGRLSQGNFKFLNNALNSISMEFNYYSEELKTFNDFASDWMSLSQDGDVLTRDCGAFTYSITTVSIPINDTDQYRSKEILNVGLVQDSKTDTIQYIVKTEKGFLITAFDAFNSYNPYTLEIEFNDNEWKTASWNGRLFGKREWAENSLAEGECEDLY